MNMDITILPQTEVTPWVTVETRIEHELCWYWEFATQQEARAFVTALEKQTNPTIKDLT